jgi:hypothetical protein
VHDAREPPPEPLPAEIAGVRVLERLRTDGPLAVHAGEDALGLPVRLHVVTAAALGTDPGADGFLRAVRDAARAQHASLVSFTTGGRDGDLVYAVAKETTGRSVDELLGRGGALAAERALAIATTTVDVLVALERCETRHGDLTPRRIQLPGRGQVAVRPPRTIPASLAPRKARYQAPEEARGEDGDIRSDLYVVGLLLIEMLTGSSPVPGSGASATAALARGDVPAAARLLPDAPAPVQAVVARLLAFAPEERFASAAEAHAALEAAARGEMPAAAVDDVPVATPLDDDRPTTAPIHVARPETAPIPPSAAQAAQDAAPVARVAAAGPAPAAGRRRGPGRLHVESRLGESLLEIDEDVYLGWPEGGLDVLARPAEFDAAVLRVEPQDDVDVLHALSDDVTVNGEAVTRRELSAGDAIAAPRLQARYERAARGVLRAAPRADEAAGGAGKARAVLAAAVVGSLAIAAIALVQVGGVGKRSEAADAARREQVALLEAAQDAEARAIAGPGEGGSDESAARAAYAAARAAARRRPGEVELARSALRDVSRRYPGTAYGLLAEIEAAELGTRGGGVDRSEVEGLITEAETDAAEGRLDQALQRLRAFAEERLDSIDAVLARRAMVRLQAEMDARVAADTDKYEAAIAAHDYPLAVRVMDRMLDYVPLSERDRVLTAKRDVQGRMDAVLRGGGTSSGDEQPPGPGPGPERPPEVPVRPPDTPIADDTPTAPDADRDADALAAFRAARRAMDSGKDNDALSGFVEFLREYKDTPTGAKYDLEVRRRITSLATGPAGVEELFRGKVERRDRGRFRITYDFEDAEQMLDFRDVNAFEAPPRAKWDVVSGAARAKGSGAFVLDAHFRPDFLTVEVKVQPERAHDLGVIVFEAGEPRRYYLYTVQNSFFQLGKGDGREDFRENAIVLFGPGMWRDAPPDEIGFVRKCGSEEPKLAPGKPAKIKCGKAEGEVWMRFPGGRTIRGSAYGDQKYEFTGLTPGVFLVNSAGYFDEVVIEGVPDADWLAQRWRDLLNEL